MTKFAITVIVRWFTLGACAVDADRSSQSAGLLLVQGGLRGCLLNDAEVCGELRLFSMFGSLGAPLDVTLASLRIEHLFAADTATAEALAGG